MADNRTAGSGQKFITRNHAPRVQIEYDVEIYGAETKVQLPFVMGVLADLAGTQVDPLPDLVERKFMEVDIDNFDERMKSLQPRVAFQVPNTLTGEGLLQVDLRFERLDDFSPAQVAGKIDPLARLLAARTELANLLTYMDGKSGAEELVAELMRTPDVLNALAGFAPQSPVPIERLPEAGKQGE